MLWSFALLILMLHQMAVRAVLFESTADPEYNTTAPPADLGASAWAAEGLWGPFAGTAIAPRYFLTARHVGGSIGDPFYLNGVVYTATAMFDDSESDLRIWQVDKDLPVYAQLYRSSDEDGQTLTVFGRGTQRGDPVTVSGPGGSQLKGWLWGLSDGRLRWGQNQVETIINGDQSMPSSSGKVGDLLQVPFKSGMGPNEGHISFGDSGGAVFIQQNGTWKLAGINFGVDGNYSYTDSGAGFEAAIFDERGLYTGTEGNWTYTAVSKQAKPGNFYATRVSAHVSWIDSVLAQPIITPAAVPIVQSASSAAGPYSDEPNASVDAATQTITLPSTEAMRFYRLSNSTASQITGIKVLGSSLVLTYTQD